MAKTKNASPRYSPPSSLYHYTSSEVLLYLLKEIIEKKDFSKENAFLNFHASESTCMNDIRENEIIRTDLNLISTDLINHFHQIKEKLYKVYVISFSRYNEKIPMWNMYGNENYGFSLGFDYKELMSDESIIKASDIEKIDVGKKYLIKCNYYSVSKIIKQAEKLRAQFKEQIKIKNNEEDVINLFNKSQLETISNKHDSFSYEDEYRIITFSNESEFKKGRYGITEFKKVGIPLCALKRITAGPLCSSNDIEKIESLCKIIQNKMGIEINVKKSNLSIR